MPDEAPAPPTPMKTLALLALNLIERIGALENMVAVMASTQKIQNTAQIQEIYAGTGVAFQNLRFRIQEETDDSSLFALLIELQRTGLSGSTIRPPGF
jgi:hypothetical protein